jgi:protocatechuate 3,4-dioxygenase beta subunit
MDGQDAGSEGQRIAAELQTRLDLATPGRLRDAVRLIAEHVFDIAASLRATPAELDAVVQFLTDVGYATDARRQEWVLLADVFGLTDAVISRGADGRATPATLPGPFYRPDAPPLDLGANLCRDGDGVPLVVSGRVTGPAGEPLAAAEVEVWHANAKGRYENQDPDNQPEHNLRGKFMTDTEGRFHFRSIRPAGYSLPDDGPVGQLARRIGLSLDRPAHVHFAVTAPGYRRLVTSIFDGNDPAIGRDALFAVKPGLIGDYRAERTGVSLSVALVLDRDDIPQRNEQEG